MITVHLHYFAILRDQRGELEETLSVGTQTVGDLYQSLTHQHGFTLPQTELRVSVNQQFVDWSTPLEDGDEVVFLPPVSGG